MALKRWLVGPLLALYLPFAAHSQAFSIPVSNKLVELEVSPPGSKPAQLGVREGSMATLHGAGREYQYALIVTLDKVSQLPKVTLLEVRDQPEGGQKVQKLGALRDVALGEAVAFDVPEGRLGVKIGRISTARFQVPALAEPLKTSPTNLKSVYGKPTSACCVSCAGFQVCAASVRWSCDTCDIPDLR